MTFTEIVAEVMDRLNLTSTDATTRIGKRVNSRYKRVTSSLGINTSRRGTTTANTTADTATLAFTMAKIELLYVTASGEQRVLDEYSYDELKSRSVRTTTTGDPREYAIKSQDGTTVTVLLYPTPGSVITISADGLLNAATLSGSDVPAFDQDFHDVLVYGAMVDELAKLEKSPLLVFAKTEYEQRLSELRYFIAKSSYLTRVQSGQHRTISNFNVKIVSG